MFLLAVAPASGAVIYVDADAVGANTGTNWADAYTNLQTALSAAVSNDEIWVKAGTYKPGTNRTDSFQLRQWVDLYGGFDGTETNLSGRDLANNVTVLNGDIGAQGTNTDNSYHVVIGTNNATIDGFTITQGKANGGGGGANMGGGMYNNGCSPTVRNCTFSGNYSEDLGGGIANYIQSSPMVLNCTFSGNSANLAGGGIANYSQSSPTILNCTFSGNSATYSGGGMYNGSSALPAVKNCTFLGNSGGESGGGMHNQSSSSRCITNCIFWSNSAVVGDEIYNSYNSTSTVGFCDIQGGWNGPGVTNVTGGGMLNGGSNINSDPLFVTGTNGTWSQNASFNPTNYQSTLTNSSATWVPGTLKGKFVQIDTNSVLQYVIVSNLSASLTVLGNFSTNALSGKQYRIYDYHLQSQAGHWESGLQIWTNDAITSPCIDAGDPVSVWTNEPTPNGGRINMGVYGNTAEASKTPTLINNTNGATDILTTSATLNGNLTATNAAPTFVWIYWGTNDGGTVKTAWLTNEYLGARNVGAFSTNIQSLTSNTLYYYRCYASNSLGDAWAPSTTNFATLASPYAGVVIYVDASAGGANTGTNWADAYTNLQTALSAAVSNDEIWAAAGTYKPGTNRTDSFQLRQWVDLYGGFDGTETNLSGRDLANNVTVLSGDIGAQGTNTDNSYHVVIGTNNATIDGFTVTRGTANGSGGNRYGGGMYNDSCSSLTVTNCTFSGNSAEFGGGIANNNQSSPTVQNCTFSGNSTESGGGIRNSQSSPTILNCTFSGNSASYSGGGMYNGSSALPAVKNCTFFGNSGGESGGGIHNQSSSSRCITNCIFWSNSAVVGDEIYNSYNSTSTVGFCDIQGGWNGPGVTNVTGSGMLNGGGNINADPLFVTGTNGTWSQNASFNPTNCQSTLTDSSATWVSGALKGKFVQIDTNSVLQYVIVSNLSASLTVLDNFSTNALSGKQYRIYDYHLQSQAGHWESGLQIWTNDAATSPCIDAGDPASAWTNEPTPNGGRVNIGAYGNTTEASKSPTAINNANGASNITGNAAILNGNLMSTSAAPTYVWVYWGTNDGGTAKSAWTTNEYLGTREIGAFSTNIAELATNTLYYYRCYATNSASMAWAATTTNFTTLSVGGSPDGTIFKFY